MEWLIYLLGQPGSGKTTLMRAAFQPHLRSTVTQPFRYHGLPHGGILLGDYTPDAGTFAGTDRLSMSVQPKVLDYLTTVRPPYVVGEGDRLGNARFFDALHAAAYGLAILYLDTPQAELERRRALRGSRQSEAWMRGRQTKVFRLSNAYAAPNMVLDGKKSVDELAIQLHGIVDWLCTRDLTRDESEV